MQEVGKLYVVATPIGNLEDITLRAITVLKNVQLIAAEDTRQSKKLLRHYGINSPLFALHAHNEKTHSIKIVTALRQNQDVAYITDAGTPLISDPGAYLVNNVRKEGFKVIPIPGPCAAIAALSVSGFSNPQFYFEGFLPNKSTARRKRLDFLKGMESTLIFYESPHRILSSLEDIRDVMGDRYVVLARELTKKYETILTGNLSATINTLETMADQRLGEFVILIAGAQKKEEALEDKNTEYLQVLLKELPVKKAVLVASKLLGVSRNQLYTLALRLSGASPKV